MAVVPRLGKGALRIEHARAVAADPKTETLFTARAALRRAYALRDSAQLQIDQLRILVDRLSAEAASDSRL